MILEDHKEFDYILNRLWITNKNSIKKSNNYWKTETTTVVPTINDLTTFQNNESLHFCRCTIDPLDPIMYQRAISINSNIADQLMSIGDSELGYTKDQIHDIRQRSPKITGWTTANHVNFLTFLLCHWQPQQPVSIIEFGGGYGNVCRLLHKINRFPISEYIIIDLPWIKDVQQYFLRNTLNPQQYERCQFVNTFSNNLIDTIPNTNLFIANHSLSELNESDFFKYEPLLHKADRLFISMCLNSIDEYTLAFHLMKNFHCEKAMLENQKVIHLIMRKKS